MNCKKCGKQVKNNNELCEECLKELNEKTPGIKSANQKLDLDLDNMDFSPSEFFSGDFSNEPVVSEPKDRSPEISVKKIQAPSSKRFPKPSEMKIFPVGTSLPPEEPTLNLDSPKMPNSLKEEPTLDLASPKMPNSITEEPTLDLKSSKQQTPPERINLTNNPPTPDVFMSNSNSSNQPKPANLNAAPNKDNAKKRKLLPLIAIFSILLLIMSAGVFYLLQNSSKEINLNEYVSINFKGYAGHGVPTYTIDYLKLNNDLSGNTIDVSEKETDILDGVLVDSEYHDFLASITCEFDTENQLSSGDTVTATISYDKKLAQKLNIVFTSSPITATVDTLPTTRDLNPFDDVQLVFNGISPYASVDVTVTSNDEVYDALTFSCDKTKNIKNGDKITVTVEYKNDNYLLENYGCILSATSQVFECTGLDSYLSSATDFSDTMLGQLQSAATNTISNYQSKIKNSVTISNINYAGYYLLTAKKAIKDNSVDYNVFYALYSAKVSGKNISSTTVYFPVKFTNITILADGTSDISKDTAEIVGTTSLAYQNGKKIKGYTDASSMKNTLANTKNGVYALKVLEIKPEVPKTAVPKTSAPKEPVITSNPTPKMVTATKKPKATPLPDKFLYDGD